MFPLYLVIGMAVLLLALLGAALAIVCPRRSRAPKPRPRGQFLEQFLGELGTSEENPQPEPPEVGGKEAYALHKKGDPPARIASTLGITRADAEMLIRVHDALSTPQRD